MSTRHWLFNKAPQGADVQKLLDAITSSLKPDSLAPDHPLRERWEVPTEENARELTQLGDDIVTVEGVPGAQRLLRILRSDADNYRDLRYELRVAANVGRSSEQRLIELAGPRSGPDIRFIARSGHECGIACYSAKSGSPQMVRLRAVAETIMHRSLAAYMFAALRGDLLILTTFERVPVTDQDVSTALGLIYEMLTNGRIEPLIQRGDVRTGRTALPRQLRLAGDVRRTRARFLFQVRSFEERRVLGMVRQKLAMEEEAWARSFNGIPLFCVEESDGCTGMIHPKMQELLASTAFACGVVTYYPIGGVESIDTTFRERSDPIEPRVHIEMKTLWDTVQSWRQGEASLTIFSPYAVEDWDFVQTSAGHGVECVRSLWIEQQLVRLGKYPDLRTAANDPAFQRAVEDAVRRSHERAKEFPRAPELLVPGRARVARPK